MSTPDKLVRALVFLLGALATAAFVITKNPTALAWATSGDYLYGDLYRFAKIERFKPEVNLATGNYHDVDSLDQGRQTPGDNEIVFMGDSFGFSDFGDTPFHMQLQQRLKTPFFTVFNKSHWDYWADPYFFFTSRTNQQDGKRYVIYEIVERTIPRQFAKPLDTNAIQPPAKMGSFSGLWPRLWEYAFENSDTRTELLLKHGIATSRAVAWWQTTSFEWFRQMPTEIGAYATNPPFLFYQVEVDCFNTVHDDDLVGNLAGNIALMAGTLEKQFGYTLIFLPVPNKITLYSQRATETPYDNFLPRLCAALKARGVRTIELLPPFQKQTDLLYWPTDTHWNNRGIRVAAEEISKSWPEIISK